MQFAARRWRALRTTLQSTAPARGAWQSNPGGRARQSTRRPNPAGHHAHQGFAHGGARQSRHLHNVGFDNRRARRNLQTDDQRLDGVKRDVGRASPLGECWLCGRVRAWHVTYYVWPPKHPGAAVQYIFIILFTAATRPPNSPASPRPPATPPRAPPKPWGGCPLGGWRTRAWSAPRQTWLWQAAIRP